LPYLTHYVKCSGLRTLLSPTHLPCADLYALDTATLLLPPARTPDHCPCMLQPFAAQASAPLDVLQF